MSDNLVFINDAFIPRERAALHIDDLLVQRGYGIFDFFKTDDGRTYFALAEVEMPEADTVPPPPPAVLAPHVLLLAPRSDPRFTSKRLADRGHAERLLADVRAKGEAA